MRDMEDSASYKNLWRERQVITCVDSGGCPREVYLSLTQDPEVELDLDV